MQMANSTERLTPAPSPTVSPPVAMTMALKSSSAIKTLFLGAEIRTVVDCKGEGKLVKSSGKRCNSVEKD